MLRKILRRIELENEENPVWIVGPKTGRMLHWLVRVIEPETIVEVGTSVGYSALWMASALEENKSGKLWTIESHSERFQRAGVNIAEAGFGDRIQQVKGHAPEVFTDGSDLPEHIDLAFFDATKQEHDLFLAAVLPRMSAGGMVVVDNVMSHRFKSLKRFIDNVHENKDLKVVEIPVGDGLLIARVL